MNIADISNNQTEVNITTISTQTGEASFVLNIDCYSLDSLENTFVSSATYPIPLNIAHKVLAVKGVFCDSYRAVLLKCHDKSDKFARIVCCHWKTADSLSYETILPICNISRTLGIQHISGSLHCLLSENNVIFVDVSKPGVVRQMDIQESVDRILYAFSELDCFIVILQCHESKSKTRRLRAITVLNTYNLSDEQRDVNDYLPSLYASVATCMAVQIHRNSDKHQKTPNNSTYICTNTKQVVCFKDGRLIRCAPLPFGDARRILLFVTPSFGKILVIHNERSCLICLDEQTGKVRLLFMGN